MAWAHLTLMLALLLTLVIAYLLSERLGAPLVRWHAAPVPWPG